MFRKRAGMHVGGMFKYTTVVLIRIRVGCIPFIWDVL